MTVKSCGPQGHPLHSLQVLWDKYGQHRINRLPGLKQAVYRAELHAVARALEKCSPHEVVSDCKGVVKAVQTLQTGRRQPKGRNRDLELR
eukprot:2112253-Amphidinium_carterae.1